MDYSQNYIWSYDLGDEADYRGSKAGIGEPNGPATKDEVNEKEEGCDYNVGNDHDYVYLHIIS